MTPLEPTCDLFVITGEPSGDAYAAQVVQALRTEQPDLVVAAMGGPELVKAGAEVEQNIEGLAVMGLFPVLARLPEFIRLGMHVANLIRARRPKVILTVDYPGFNLRLLRNLSDLRRSGTRFVHLVAPQVWAWKPRRAKSIAHTVDRLLCFFPFEPPLFTRFGVQADFIGHPLADLSTETARAGGPALDAELGLVPGQRLLLLAPGSREREIAKVLPVFHLAAEALRRRVGPIAVAIAKVPDRDRDLYRRHSHLPLVEGRYRELCARAHVGAIASGTATLEAGLLRLPHAICYRMDRFSAVLARQLIRTEHVGLPNLVLGRRAVPELLQDQLTPERLVLHLQRFWEGPKREECLASLDELRMKLGAGGAVNRIADAVREELSRGRRQHTVL